MRTCVHVRPPHCACANVVRILLVLKISCCLFLVQEMSWGRTRGQVIDINRSPKIETPRLHKRQHSAPGSLSQLSPREAETLRDGYDSTPDPAYSCLRCSAQRQTATWLLYRVLYSLLASCSVCHFAHARPTMPSISLVVIRWR